MPQEKMMSIVPYISVGPLQFGMSANSVEERLGPPRYARNNRRGETEYEYPAMNVRFSKADGKLVEISLLPGSEAKIENVDLFDADAFCKLLELDGNPFEYAGFLLLLKLGIALTGFHDHDGAQLAVTAFSHGRWDEMLPHFKKFAI